MHSNNNIKVVSLFDGISCGRVALEKTGYAVSSYIAYEIDKYARAVSRYNFPDIKQCGNVLDADFSKYVGYDFVMGGSPCTFWSIANAGREISKGGMGWKLFMQFVEAIRQIKPRHFLYENVVSMPNNIRDYISEELGCAPILINSALVSAQNRKRLYWTNIKGVTQPTDRGILLKDILESGMPYQDKSHCMTASYSGAVLWNSLGRSQRSMVAEPIALTEKSQTILATMYKENALSMVKRRKMGLFVAEEVSHAPIRLGSMGAGGQGNRIYSIQGKTVSLVANGGGLGAKTGLYKIDLPDGDYCIRKLTPIEAERLQTLPDNYTSLGIDDDGKTVEISKTQRYKAIGNGWTVDVISHILSHIAKGR